MGGVLTDSQNIPSKDARPGEPRRADAIALAFLLLGIGIVSAHRFYYDNWLARHDLLTFFLPWHGHLGERLANFDVPGWSSHLFSGAPFLGDPESGWLYFPSMVVFPFLSITVAMKALILIQLLIGGTATYSLGRVLGFGALGALMSASAFVFGPFLVSQTQCCTVASELSGWLPVAFLGVELGLRTRRWLPRIAAWSMSGFAISQMFATWLGQGAAIALLMVAAWIGYRGMIDPSRVTDMRNRLVQTFAAGFAVLVWGLGIGAAGLLPRLAVNAESTIKGGDYTNVPGGRDESPISLPRVIGYLLRDNRDDRSSAIGGVLIILVLVAIVLAGRRYAVPFFVAVFACTVILATPMTLLHELLFLIPRVEDLQMHSPSRVMWLVGFCPAMLAGAGLQALLNQRAHWRNLLLAFVPIAALYVLGAYLDDHDILIDRSIYIAAWATTLLVAAVLVPWGQLAPDFHQTAPRIGAVALIVLVFFWPNVPEMVATIRDPSGNPFASQISGRDASIAAIVDETLSPIDPGGAGEFFQRQQANGGVFRYAAWAGLGSDLGPGESTPSRRMQPVIVDLLVNGRPFQLDLQQVAGYNPLQLEVYTEYMAVVNGQAQDYHHSDLFAAGVDSPLIDMLNVEYFIIDATMNPNREDVQAFMDQGPEVFRGDHVVVIRNDSAFPRAWIVHDVRPGDVNSLQLLNRGSVDGRQVAFVDEFESGMFPVAAATGAADVVIFDRYSDDAMSMRVTAEADGLLVLSEVFAKGWNAYVDGKRTDVLQTNHALRGVPVSAGTHEVELRYEPREIALGLWITGVTGTGMVVVWALVAAEWWRRPVAGA